VDAFKVAVAKAVETAKASASLTGTPISATEVNVNSPLSSLNTERMILGVEKQDVNTGHPVSDSDAALDNLVSRRIPNTFKGLEVGIFGYSVQFSRRMNGIIKANMVRYISSNFNSIKSRQNSPAYDTPTTTQSAHATSAIDTLMASKSFQTVAGVVGNFGDAMDVLGVVMLFADAFFMNDAFVNYGQDPVAGRVPRLLSGGALSGAIAQTINAQDKAIREYNDRLRDLNLVLPGTATPYTYLSYPQISGPLDHLERDLPRKTVYHTQARVLREISDVQEALLRNPANVHGALMSSYMGADVYEFRKNNGSDKLWWFVGGFYGLFAPREADALYEDAFTAVCEYNGGKVYKDTHTGTDTSGVADPIMSDRTRMQCGWPTAAKCTEMSNTWATSSPDLRVGNYVEWFNWDDLEMFPWDATKTVPTYNSDVAKVKILPTGHPLRSTPGVTGACIVSNSGIRQMCSQAKGRYDPVSHTCVFTPQFCQAIGTCYDQVSKTCYLVPDTLKGLSVLMGDQLPREFIRLNGCNFYNNFGSGITNDTDITTSSGLDWQKDAVSYNKNLSANFKSLLASPAYAAGFATSVSAVATEAFALTAAGGAAITRANIAIGAEVSAVAAADGAVATARIGARGYLVMIELLAIGSAILAEYMKGWQISNQMPAFDPPEWTIGGLDSDGNPQSLSYAYGWVTKPRPLTQNISSTPGGYFCKFYGDQDAIAAAAGYAGRRGAMGSAETARGVEAYTSLSKDPVPKIKCAEGCGREYTGGSPATPGIIAGSKATGDLLWCLPRFPANGLFDSTLGPLATTDSTTTNKSWTNGKELTIPQLPGGGAVDGPQYKPGDTAASYGQWFYQFVYDKDQFGNAHLNNDGMPSHIWDTARLRVQFRDSQISEMRRYYCQTAFSKYIVPGSGITMNPKCFAYLTIDLGGYKFMPMTNFPRMTPAV
jgi:hypothetical protein